MTCIGPHRSGQEPRNIPHRSRARGRWQASLYRLGCPCLAACGLAPRLSAKRAASQETCMISKSQLRWALTLVLPLTLTTLLVSAGGPAKLPVPSEAAQDKARKLGLEVFNDDLHNAKDPAARAKLAAELLQQGRDTKDDRTLRYVLLQEARDLAAASGDAGLAFNAIDDLARTFAIDPLANKAQALESAVANADSKERGKDLLDLTLPLVAEALEADNYQAARVLGKVAEA